MRHWIHSEAGHNHINEDAVAIESHPQDPSLWICVLADGQGGQAGGGAASRLAVTKAIDLAAAIAPGQLRNEKTWLDIVAAVDDAVRDDNSAGFTTLIVAAVDNRNVCGAACGDSLGLLVDSQNFLSLTQRQRKNPPVGTGAAFPVAFSPARPEASKVLLTSDGVWRFIGSEAIAAIARENSGTRIIEMLRRQQLQSHGGRLGDDFSLIIIE
jgi:serine/threonine protein phosphatase PrpC